MHHLLNRLPRHVVWLLAAAAALGPTMLRAAEPQVLAVAAVDSFADVRKQLMWLGGQIGQPALAVAADTTAMMATQGRGLNGLDVTRPAGVVVTTDGTLPIVHGYIPVKNLDKFLESLQASIGLATKDGDVRRVNLPSGTTLEFTERVAPNGTWAVAALPGSPAGMADPLPLLEGVAKEFSTGLRVYPSLMPEPLRKQLEEVLDRAARQAAAQGQPIAPGTIESFVAGLADTESLAVGMAIDAAAQEVFLATDATNVAGSPAAARMTAAKQGTLTVGLPPRADGQRAAISGHVAQVIPADLQPAVVQSLDDAVEQAGDDPLAKALATVARSLVAAALGTGTIEAALAVDTSAATKEAALPAVTAGVRVKDGRALEAQLKKALGDGSALPGGVTVAFDAGTAGDTKLHTVRVAIEDEALAERIGDALELTLAVAPEYAFVLAGGDVKKRAAAAAAASGKAVADAKPIADLRVAVDEMLAYSREVGAEPVAEKGSAAARAAGGGTMLLAVRPIERGMATRVSIDAAALKAAAAMAAPPPRPGLPAGVPMPQGFPIPAPAR